MKTNYRPSSGKMINYLDFTSSSGRTGYIENSIKPDTLMNVTKNSIIIRPLYFYIQK